MSCKLWKVVHVVCMWERSTGKSFSVYEYVCDSQTMSVVYVVCMSSCDVTCSSVCMCRDDVSVIRRTPSGKSLYLS